MATTPLIAITRTLTPSGQPEVTIDGRHVSPEPGESADQAALRAAARLADRAPGRVVHADMADEHGASWRVAIHADGSVLALPNDEQDEDPTTQLEAVSPAPAPLSLPDTTPAPRRHPTRHLAGATALTASLTGLRRRITKRQLSVAAVVLAALVVVGAIALAMHTMVSGDAPSQSATTAVAVTPGGVPRRTAAGMGQVGHLVIAGPHARGQEGRRRRRHQSRHRHRRPSGGPR
ncbi:hypothetical protein GCM10025883_44430 [Mobilicoccus caccae]|uniref:Uncharacterized protein n=1 Tax=Mobilicoccus caccae TaxID=1859295 RepID=A0ABQ6IWR3_9MICO|nr:hypothetical protein GCM10025883_44430 [Mobilicoccus caccae]